MSADPRSIDKTLLARGGAVRIVGMCLQIGVAFLLMPYMVARLGQRQYGFWTLIGDTLWYYTLLDAGLSSAVTRFVARARGEADHQKASAFASGAFRLFVIAAGVVALLSVTIATAAPRFAGAPDEQATFAIAILLLGGSLALGFPVRAHIGILNAWLRFDLTALSSVVRTVTSTSLMFVALFLNAGLVGLAMAAVTGQALEYCLLVYWRRRVVPLVVPSFGGAGRAEIVALLSFSWKSMVAQLADLLRYRLDSVVIVAYLGLAPVAVYAVGARLVESGSQFAMNALGIFTPVFSALDGRGDREAVLRTLKRTLRLSAIVTLPIFGVVLILGRPFIEAWMGRGFDLSFSVVAVLAVPMALALIQSPAVAVLYSMAQHHYYMMINITEGIANLVLSLWLVRRFGIVGVSLGTAIPMFVSKVLVQPWVVSRVLGVRPMSLFGLPYWGFIARMALPFVVYGWFTHGAIAATFSAVFAHAAILGVIVTVYIWMLGLTGEERTALQAWIVGRFRRPRVDPVSQSS